MDEILKQKWEQVDAFETSEPAMTLGLDVSNHLRESKPGLILVVPGDIPFLAPDNGGDLTSGKKKTIGHAVIIAKNTTDIIEARGDGDGGYNKVIRSDLAAWLAKQKEIYVIWAAHGDTIAPDSVGVAAAGYAESKLERPYNRDYFNRWDESSFYCSQLCWRSWYNQGYKLDYDEIGPFDIKSKDWVSPNDLIQGRIDCRVLYVIRKQG